MCRPFVVPCQAKEKSDTLLRQIDYNHFSKAPSALMLHLSIAGPEQYPAIKAILDTHFTDSFEWLAQQAEEIPEPAWRAMKAGKEPFVRGPRRIERDLGPIQLPAEEKEETGFSNWYFVLLLLLAPLVVYVPVYLWYRKKRGRVGQ